MSGITRLPAYLAVAAIAALVAACSGSSTSIPPAPSSAGPATSAPPSASSAPAPTSSPSYTFGYQPLFPFASLADAQIWEASFTSGGHQPWHLDAGLTAVAFSQGYLGFQEISQVVNVRYTSSGAHVAVGFSRPGGGMGTAAIVHLVKYGTSKNAPWEVVGTDDTTLTLDIPVYGGTATSPVKIGGTITGVDENLRAEVHTLSAAGAVGSFCCQAAGGQGSPWSLTVPFQASTGQVITIVVHTGGHVAAVERFAVTGVQVG